MTRKACFTILALLILTGVLVFAGCTKPSTTTSQPIEISSEPSDRDLIYNAVNNERDQWYSSYELEYWFLMKELETPLNRYSTKLYRCVWTLDFQDDEIAPTFINQAIVFVAVKGKTACPLKTYVHEEIDATNFHELDFDHDGQNEIIYFIDSGVKNHIYQIYVFEAAADEPIYKTKCTLADPIVVENGQLVIKVNDDRVVTDILKYRTIDGQKGIFVNFDTP